MPVAKTWPSGSSNPTPTVYNIPLNGELNWTTLSTFLQAIADGTQSTTFQKYAIRTATSNPVSVSATTDCAVFINLGVAGAVTVNLPAGVAKQVFYVVDAKGDAATNNITINPNGADTISGAASLVLNKNYQGVVLIYNSGNWQCFGPFLTPGSVTDSDFSGVLTTAKGGTGQNSTATFPTSGTVAVVPAAGVVKSDGTSLSSSNVNLASEVTGILPTANGGTGQNSTATFPSSGAVAVVPASGVVKSNGTVLSSSNVNLASEVTGILPTANGGTGQNSTATFPSSGTVAVVPASGVVKSNGTVLSSSNVNLASEVTGTLPIANGGTGQTTATAAFDALSPLTTKGDVLTNDGTNDIRLPVGSNGQVLSANSAQTSGLEWISTFTNPMTTTGDTIYGGVAGAPQRLAAGTSGQLYLSAGAAAPSWTDTVTTLKTFNQGVATPIVVDNDLTISTAIGVQLINPTINTGRTWTLNHASAYLAAIGDIILSGDLVVTNGTVRII